MSWAEALVYSMMLIGSAVSLFSFFAARRIYRSEPLPQFAAGEPRFDEELFLRPVCMGELTVDAPSAEALLNELAVQLQNPLHASIQSPWILSAALSAALRVERDQSTVLSLTAQNLKFKTGKVIVEQSGSKSVRVRYALHVESVKKILTLACVWPVFSLLVSIVVPLILIRYTVNSPNPNISGQSFQVFQIAQVLWEPFLFMHLGRTQVRGCGNHLESIIKGCAYELETGRQAGGGRY